MEQGGGMAAYRREEDIVQNLKDADCDDATIRAFMDDFRRGKIREGTRLLQTHRRRLLDDLHKDQKCIDCLDYLLFMLQR